MTNWGRKMFVTPGVVVDGKLVTNDLVQINLGIRILLGHSYYDDWENEEMFVPQDPLGNPVDRRHPWNMHTLPDAEEARLRQQVQLGDVAALVRRQGLSRARHRRRRRSRACGRRRSPDWSTWRLHQSDRQQRADQSAQERAQRPGFVRVEDAEVVERDRAQSRAHVLPSLLPPPLRCTSSTRPSRSCSAGRTRSWEPFTVPKEAIGCGFTEAVRGVLSHHMVIRDGKIANYHPWPPTPWNGNPRDIYGTPGPYEDAVQNTPIFEENGPENFKGIDIMRAVRSFDPCLPCGVHMYLGDGKTHRDGPFAARAVRLIVADEPNRTETRLGGPAVDALLADFDSVSTPRQARELADELVRTIVTCTAPGSNAC